MNVAITTSSGSESPISVACGVRKYFLLIRLQRIWGDGEAAFGLPLWHFFLLGSTNTILLYTVLPLALLLVLAVPVSALLALWINRKSRQTPPAPLDPAANNVLQPDAVHLIRNITHRDAESGLREPGTAVKAGLALHPPCGPPKTDISNEERAKLNRLNASPALPQPPLL